MRKYRLKIDLGDKKAGEVQEVSSGKNHNLINKIAWTDENGITYTTELNNTKIWEPVVDYVITSLVSNRHDKILTDAYNIDSWTKGFTANWKIGSIRRFDNVVFTIGDEIVSDYYIGAKTRKILGFEYDNGDIRIRQNTGTSNILHVEHAPKSKFTTEDGVSLYVGDKYYYVNRNNLVAVYANFVSELQEYTDNRYIRFSSVEIAEKYIEDNTKINITISKTKHNEIKHLL